jgi:hypothetical protein
VSTRLCTVCGAVLRDGVCPNGHPQRVASRAREQRRAGPLFVLVAVLVLLLAGGAYTALKWYPRRAATDLMRPSSAEFTATAGAYHAAIGALPPASTDPQVLVDQSATLLSATGTARQQLTDASSRLDGREPTDLPVISDRPPLGDAIGVREEMLAFYTTALETIADVESVAGYLSSLAPVLPELDDLAATLESPEDLNGAVAAATPVADQVIADLQALTPPDELGGLHSSLAAIARRIRADLDELTETGQAGSPVTRALLQDLRTDIGTLRETMGTAPDAARQAGLGTQIEDVEARIVGIIDGLATLRDRYDISGLTIP